MKSRSSVSSAAAAAESGGNQSKMILWDSVRDFHRRTSAPSTPCSRSNVKHSDIVSELNRFESLEPNLRSCGRPYGGRGGLNLYGVFGPLPHGSHAQIFYGRQRFELFSRNQRNQSEGDTASDAKPRICKELESTSCPVLVLGTDLRAFVFPSHGRGVVKSLGPSKWKPVGQARVFRREIARNYFFVGLRVRIRKIVAKFTQGVGRPKGHLR